MSHLFTSEHSGEVSYIKKIQIIDLMVLMTFLIGLGTLVFMSFKDVESGTKHHLDSSIETMEQSKRFTAQFIFLEQEYQQYYVILESIKEKLFEISSEADSSRVDISPLYKLQSELVQSHQRIMALKEKNRRAFPKQVKEHAEKQDEYYQNLIKNIKRMRDLGPETWWKSADDALLHADVLLSKLRVINNVLEQNFYDQEERYIQAINIARDNIRQTTDLLNKSEMTVEFGIGFAALLILVSRLFFSRKLKMLAQSAFQAREYAEEASNVKSRFLATMSHEIRTPMNGVIGLAHMLSMTELTHKQREYVDSINISGKHLLMVINDVLDFSKIEAGKLHLKEETVELRLLVENILNVLSAKAFEKNLELNYFVDPSLPLHFKMDDGRLSQILTNLVGNSIKFTASGSVTIFVRKIAQLENNYTLKFEVADTGIGIPEDQIDKVFGQYEQVDSAMSRKFEGTGLGLAISHGLIQLMNGKIWVESVLGEGSQFFFTADTSSVIEEPSKRYLKRDIPSIINKHVLVVDQNEISLQTLVDQCMAWGAIADSTVLPDEALELVEEKSFDFVIVDCIHSENHSELMDFVSTVRLLYSHEELPIILLSQEDEISDPELLELFSYQISKPLNRSKLFDGIMNVLGDSSQGDVAQSDKRRKVKKEKLASRVPIDILLAEDNEINRMVASAIFGEFGYELHMVENGKLAWDAIKEKRYDIIFMDLQMPEMDGLTATKKIRGDDTISDQPIIVAMTANALEGYKETCLEAGMNDYISKPVLPDVIEKVIEEWCAKDKKPQAQKAVAALEAG